MLESLRLVVYEYNMELPKKGLVVMTSGNGSGHDPETGLVVIKPSGFSYETMTPSIWCLSKVTRPLPLIRPLITDYGQK